MKLVAIISSLLLITGSWLPWVQSETFAAGKNVNTFESLILLVLALLSLAISLYDQLKSKNNLYNIYIIIGLLSFIVTGYSIVQGFVHIRMADPESRHPFLSYWGAGAWLILTGIIGLLVAGFWMRRRFHFSFPQSITAGFIANRIAFSKSSSPGSRKSFSRFIIRLSITATIISVMVMIVTLSLANGFQQTVSQKVFSFWGHIRIEDKQPGKAVIAEETPIVANDTLVDAIRKNPDVESIHPFATKYAILKTKDDIEGVLVKGLDSNYAISHFKPFIQAGRFIHFTDSNYTREIMISAYTATQLKLQVNDRILIYFIRPDGNIRPDKLTVTGIYKTGIEEYDKTFAIGDIRLVRKLNDWRSDEIGGYEIFLHDYTKIEKATDDIYDMEHFPQTWNTVSVKDISPNIFDWLNMQDTTRDVLISFMVIVAVINLITCLIILVLERIRMIGILKSLGATDWTIQKIFLQHSAYITITGIVAGILLALGLLWLQQATGFIKLKEEAYYMSTAAVKIVWWEVGLVGLSTLAICFLVLMIPSLLVKRIRPIQAIRFN